MIALVDYGMGNLRSVAKAVEAIGGRVKITSSPKDLKRSQKIILPGVGAFRDAVRGLKKKGLWQALISEASKGKPLMGICLGYQLLFSSSDEGGKVTRGLDLIEGKVKRFPLASLCKKGYKVPHMGWNQLEIRKKSALMKDVKNNSYFYFVHSYYPQPKDRRDILGQTRYGRNFASAIERGNLSGFQFHPEKSQKTGLKILKNFISLS